MKMSVRLTMAGVLSVTALPALAGGCGGSRCYREEYTPAQYETVHERVLLRAPRTYARVIPAEYGQVAETVMVSPGGRTWQVTRDAHGRAVGCWVDVPPRYATRHRTVQVSAEQVVPVAVPAVYGTRSHTVQVSAPSRGWVPVGGSSFGGGSFGGGFSGGAAFGGGEVAPAGYGGGYGRQAGYGHGQRSHGGGYARRDGFGGGYGQRGYGGGYVGGVSSGDEGGDESE